MCRLSWTTVEGVTKRTPWFSTLKEVWEFDAPQWTASFLLEATSLSPCLDEPTEWTDLQVMPKKAIQSLSPKTSTPVPATYKASIEKPLKQPIPTKPLTPLVTYQSSEVYWEEGQGYIAPDGTRITYTDLAQLNAGTLVRKADIDFEGEPQSVASLLHTSQNVAYWCGFKDVEFLAD